jgi:hypothetical protein
MPDNPKQGDRPSEPQTPAAAGSKPMTGPVRPDQVKPILESEPDDKADASVKAKVPAVAAAAEPKPSARAVRAAASRRPSGKELRRLKKEYFGDEPGTIRIDAPPANSGDDAPPVKLVYVDGSGRKVGEQDYDPEAVVAGKGA